MPLNSNIRLILTYYNGEELDISIPLQYYTTMNPERKTQILTFVRNQIAQSQILLKTLVLDPQGGKLPYRDVYTTVSTHIRDFSKQGGEPRWIAIAGLRGVGKTTILAQLFSNLEVESDKKLYLSLDQTTSLGFSLQEILAAYEELLGTSFEALQTPVFLFLDEVQYQKDWGVIVKTIYDRSRNIFILTTGSSALSLATNADIARRMVFEKLYPLGFAEYIHAKFHKSLSVDLADRIKKALFFSENADEVFEKLQKETGEVTKFWAGIERFEVNRYFKYGSLPFSLGFSNEQLIYQQVQKVMNNIITNDVTQLNAFDKPTLSKLSQLLYAIAGADTISISKLASTITLDPKTLIVALDAFEKTEVLLRIMPYGAHYSQVKKPSKYLFTSSAYRAMYYNLVGSIEQYENYKGKLLEDVMAMYLTRLFGNQLGTTSLTYDSAEVGADFILEVTPGGGKIVIEAGTGNKGRKGLEQTVNTLRKVKGKYGLIVSQTHLKFDKETNCVSVPLEYFLLI